MKHIKKIASYSMVGSLGLTIVSALQGCDAPQDMTATPNPTTQSSPTASTTNNPNEQNNIGNLQSDLKEQNYFLVIEQTGKAPDRYQLAEKHPTEGETRAILKQLDGTEKILSNEELKALAEAEAKKVEEGTSALTQPPSASSGGLGLGEMILASAAGALIGGMIANRLANNSNFQQNQQANTRPAAQISRQGQTRPAPSNRQPAQPRSGFFNGNRGSGSSAGGAASSFGG
ncbi:MAG TPA: hypothetical protein ENK78_09455 [Thiothrix sp.]|nr:hypothetical protein [Thiothrix sp.]